jgi:hypothetical protein
VEEGYVLGGGGGRMGGVVGRKGIANREKASITVGEEKLLAMLGVGNYGVHNALAEPRVFCWGMFALGDGEGSCGSGG